MPQTTAEILAEVRRTAAAASGKNKAEATPQAKKKSGNGWSLKSLVKDYVYDSNTDAPSVEPTGETYTDVPEFAVPENTSDDLSAKPFEEIYTEAGIGASTCDIDELAALIESPEMKGQPLNFKVMAVPFALKAKGVEISVPLTNAANRDAALDGYQVMLAKRAAQISTEADEKIATINKELEDTFAAKQAEIEALKSEASSAQNQNLQFVQRRNAEEKRMADLIAPFLSGQPNPVTVGNTPVEEAVPATIGK